MSNKIRTLHPDGKKGVNIDLDKYELIRVTILEVIQSYGEITYQKLNTEVIRILKGKFQGSIPWYVVTVKLDLEARRIIERIPITSPHVLRIKK
jgi:hypothetical protein